MVIVDGILRPGTVRCDKYLGVQSSANRIKCCEGRARIVPILIDRRAEHDLLTFETGMANADYSVAVYASEDHITLGNDV